MRHYLLTLLLVLTTIMPTLAITPQQAVDAFANDSSLRHASLGIAVVDLDSAHIVACHGLEQADITASTMKVVTSSAALALLGGDYRFETPVYLDGEVKGNRFKGNLVVRGIGDPTLGTQYLPVTNIVDEIVTALHERGISKVEGAIVCDDSYYPFPYYHSDWDVGDLAYGYGTAVHSLNFHDNLMKVSFQVNDALQVSLFTITPQVPGLNIINRMQCGNSRDAVSFGLEYGTQSLVLTGDAVPRAYDFTFANPCPAAMLADSIAHALKTSGIKFKNKDNAYKKIRNPQRQLLLLHSSPQLTDIITSLLDRSDNMYAHALLRAIGAHDRSMAGRDMMQTNLDAVAIGAVKRWLNSEGIATDALFMRDGSGLARANKASPLFMTSLLSMMAERKWNGKRLCELMPSASGRVGNKLKSTRLATDVVLKSGSMSDVQCFIGYYPAQEPQYAFAILVNNYNISRANLKEAIGSLLCNLFDN